MIRLYCQQNDPSCQELREALSDLVIVHEVIDVDGERRDRMPDLGPLPVLTDDGRTVRGLAAVREHIEYLNRFAAQWRKYQVDACYCDEEGNVE